MVSKPVSTQRNPMAQETRERFVADAGRAMVEIVSAVQERLTVLMGEAVSSRDMQVRRDAWTFYQRVKTAWRDATVAAWQKALLPASVFAKADLQDMDRIYLSFALGKALEDQTDYAASWRYYERGNVLRRATGHSGSGSACCA